MIIRVINEQWFLIPGILFFVLVVVFVYFPSLGFVAVRLSVAFVFVDTVSFLGLEFSF